MSAWLGKAGAQRPGREAEALVSARLAPDVFLLATQVRFACVQAQEGVVRLQGRDFPDAIGILLDERRNAGERPGSIADARARIEETLAAVGGRRRSARRRSLGRRSPTLPAGIIFDLTAEGYARDWALPQFYFHVLTAYAAKAWTSATRSTSPTWSRTCAPARCPPIDGAERVGAQFKLSAPASGPR